MKANLLSFVRGLKKGTPPRFQSYLKSLTILLGLMLSVNVWGETATGTSSLKAATSYYDLETGKLIECKNSAANTYSSPVRIYANNTFTFHCKTGAEKITKIVITANSNDYATKTKNATWSASGTGTCSATASVSSSTVTVTVTGTATTVTCKPSDQIRWNGATVTYTASKTLSLISVKTAPTKTTYIEGDHFDPTGLEITKKYSDNSTEDLTYVGHTSDFTFNPTTSTALTTSNTSVTITVGDKTTTQDIIVNAKVAASITLMEAGATVSGPTGKYSGDEYTLPTTCNQSCGDKTFVGWSTETVDSKTKPIADTYHEPGDKVILGVSNTFYAVFADASSGGVSKYDLVESALTDWSGDYLIVYNNTYAMTTHYGNQNANTYSTYTDISSSYNNKSIASNTTTDALVYHAAKTDNGYSLYCVSDNSYLGVSANTTSTGSKLRWNTTYAASDCDWILGVGSIQNYGSNTIYIRWNNNSGQYRFAVYNSNGQQAIQLFKKSGGATYSNYTTSCKSLTGIAVKTAPTKVDYTIGDKFAPAGLKITATYDDNSTEDIEYIGNEDKFTFTPDLTTGLTNQTSVTIVYGGQTCTQDITVSAKPALSSITLSGTYRTNFIKNEEFSKEGLVVTAHYGAITEDVTSQAEISGYNKSALGNQTITVSFTDGNTQSATYNVNVWELSASSSNTDLGTVGRSAYVITGNPKEGVTYANPAYTVDGSADVVQGTDANINKFTVSNVTADTKVTINFVEKVKDIYIDEMHGQLATGNIFYESYNAPNINYSHTTTGDDCQDGHIYFAGWSATSSQVGSATAPADMFAAGASKTASGATYYAVWAAGEVTTFNPNDISGTPAVSGENLTWQSTATGVKLKLSAGQLYTSGSPKTFTVNNGTSNYFQISHVSKTIDNLEVTISGTNYKINSVTKGTLTTSGTTHYVKGINATSVQCKSTSSYQIRATQIKVTCLSDYLTACCTPLVVTGLEVTEQTTNSLTFSWNGVADAIGYGYKLSTADEWTPTTGTSATISGLEAGTEYTIQVRAIGTGNYCATGTIAEVKKITYYNTEINISKKPNKTVYVEGDLFDKEGMVVWYTHETTRTSVSSDVTWTPDGALTPDVTEITVSYKVNDDVTLTTTQAITVKAKWTMLYYINGAEHKRDCAEGDAAEVPEVPAIDGFTFVGWVTEAMASETPIKPTYALAANATKYTPTANNDKLYTVYERKEISVLTGSALSVSTGTSTYYVGGYTSSYYSETDIENASVFFFDEEGQFYTYVDGKKMYITLAPTGTGVYQNATCPTTTSIDVFENTMDNTIRIACDGSSENRYFGRNNNPTRFGSYKTTSQDYLFDFTKTPKSIEASQSYYNTSAVVPNVHHIEVKTEPKKEYFEGDKFDATGLVVWAYYSADDEVGKEVPASQYTMKIGENTDLSYYQLQPSDENVTITFRNASVNQSIKVNAFALTAIGITTVPNQDKYFVGADFNPEGMVVMAYFNDERQNKTIAQATEQAPDGYTIIDGSNLQLGRDKVTISYTYREVTKTADQAITVNSALNEIRVGHNPTKMTYIEGEFFDKTGMVVEGRYGESADWKEVTGWTYAPTTVLKDKGTLSAAEQVKVTISYTESGTTKTIEDFYVTVNPYPKYTVTFNVNGKTDVIAPITEDTPEGGITIPANPANIGDYTFVGWAEATMAAESPEKPAMIAETVGATYHITANKTLYAVYTQEKVGKVQGYTYTMDINGQGTEKTISYFSSSSLYPVSTGHDAMVIYYADGYMFYYSGETAHYIYFTDLGDAKLTDGTVKNTAKSYLWTEIKNDNGTYSYYRTNGASTRYLGWNNSNSYWRAYNSTYENEFTRNAVAGQQADFLMPHYTTSPSTAKTPEVKFATTTANVNVLASENPRTLNTYKNTLSTDNEEGAVVYTLADGDDAVAEIAQDGTVTAKKAGTVTVTATVAAVTDKWFEASASYTLTFNKMTPSVQFTDPITEVYGGNTYTYVATTTSDGTVQYSMANETNATIGQTDGQLVVKEYSTITSTTKSATIYATVPETDLYKATTNSTRGSVALTIKSNGKKQTLTFATPEGYDFAPNATVEPFTNTLSGAVTEVTYSLKEGSTVGLVTVNETTGEVTVNTNLSGSATVVATAKEDNITEDGTIWAYQEATAEYTINVSYFRPVMTFTPGLVNQDEQWRGKQTVTLTAQEGDKIYYTLNGADPTTSSTLYEAEFEISAEDADNEGNLVIKAIAVSNDGAMTSPVLSKTLTVAVPTMTAKAKDVDVTSDSEIKLDANDVVTLKASACKIEYCILNASGTELEKKVGDATTQLTFSKGGTFTLEATPRWNVTNGFSGETQTWTVTVKGAGHLPINFNGNNTDLAELSYFTKDGTFGNYTTEHTKIQIKGGTLTVSFLEEPTELSYYIKLNGDVSSDNLFVVEGSATGAANSWTEISRVVGENITTTETQYQFSNINPDFRYIRWTYTKKSGNLGLGDIHIGTNSLIVDNDQDLDPNFNGSVIVENGGKLTVVDLSEITDLTIEPGGVVDAHTYTDAALTVNNLYLQSADHKSGQFLIDNDDIALEAYFDLTLNAAPRTWYDFAVPFKVNRNSISLANGGAMPEYDIMQYNGETRAANGANKSAWEYVDEGDLNPGTFYMIMFASNVETIRFTKNDGALLNNAGEIVEVNAYASSNPLDANWNGIANNTLQYANLGFLEDGNANIKAQVYHPGDKNYTTYKQDEVTFVVGAPFFVQVAKYDFADWSYPTIYNEVLRAPSNVTESVGEFTLELIANGVTYDRLFVSASEDATDSYQIGHDLAKMGISTTVAQMWINNYNTKLCANEAVLINGQATYQMEVFVPEAGEYKIAITSAPENATLYLTIDGQVAWNLSESAYVANLTKGTHSEFGLLLIANEKVTPTNINGLKGNNKAQKIFKDQNIYILRDTKMYNAQGIKVQ